MPCTSSLPGHAGFSLIELLVVISVIAVLASMLLPVVPMVRENARRVVCGSQMRQVGMALVAYRTDNEGAYPSVYWNVNNDYSGNSWSSWTYRTTTGRWQHGLEEFTGTYSVFNCPSAIRFYPNAAVHEIGSAAVPRGSAPANGVGTWATCLTAINSQTFGPAPTPANPSNATDSKIDTQFAALNKVLPPGSTPYTRGRCPVITDGIWQNDGTNQQTNNWGCYFPHRLLKANLVFGDGHVEVHTKGDFTSYSPVQVRE